jgi:hypothetical protein
MTDLIVKYDSFMKYTIKLNRGLFIHFALTDMRQPILMGQTTLLVYDIYPSNI